MLEIIHLHLHIYSCLLRVLAFLPKSARARAHGPLPALISYRNTRTTFTPSHQLIEKFSSVGDILYDDIVLCLSPQDQRSSLQSSLLQASAYCSGLFETPLPSCTASTPYLYTASCRLISSICYGG
ncbi:hypothetical protein BDV96DRAFT_172082 [Lophiotrema nucula]|uniref:Uncharacterized protein n=1 Tax=Lophiotrema nucula TaxID=690887 RepID=A0A6A5YYI2_9PLEO|nr:hypothetical protein BDV96DRAFT_172082 [Lophiotrema nucula]